ncbi:MAG TPA: sulfite exporter TauE/SafE family protein [Chitinophagaceae bacterium]|nr:sulfite exporter TauE/SafE family protein [Chitinophagaceae bacterium]
MDNILLLMAIGFAVGTLGTLIGAGGGFILVPVLIFAHPDLPPAVITAISMAIVACNALSGTVAYASARRIDYRAGLQFALFTIPGSILGVKILHYISPAVFTMAFGLLMIILGAYLFFRKNEGSSGAGTLHNDKPGLTTHTLTDKKGHTFTWSYNRYIGWFISVIVGFISPILGIGGGIIQVPALVHWLRFPVHLATATSHFILAIMAFATVVTHIEDGNYNDHYVLKLVIYLAVGVIAGAQLGAFLSHKIKGHAIIKALAVSLALVGIRIIFQHI